MKTSVLFVCFLITFVFSDSSQKSKILSRSTENGKGDPLMWFLLQQISALSSTLEKVRDIADKSYKDISSLSRDFSDFKKVKESGDANDKLTELQTKFDKSQSKLEQLGKRIDKIGDKFGNIKSKYFL